MSAASPLSGRHALITGAGGGIGAAIATALKAAGFNVVINDVVEDAAKEFTARTGIPAYIFDVSNFESTKAGIAKIVAALKVVGVKQATLDQITAWAATIKADAAAVATATATVVAGTSSATYVQEAMQTLSAIAGVVMPLLLPGGGTLVIVVQAFLGLVPELAAALGLTSAPLIAPPMTVAAARAVLSQPH